MGGFDISVTDRTAEYGLLNVQGPKAKEVLLNVADSPDDVDLGFSKNKLIQASRDD